MIALGIFMQGPNTGACLVRDGALVAAAEEERFTRQKRASEAFPSQSIRFCLRQAALSLREVDVVATAWDHTKYPARMDAHMRRIPNRHLDPLADQAEALVHGKLSPEMAGFRIKTGLSRIDPEAAPRIEWYAHHECHAASVQLVSGFDASAILVIDGSGEEVATSTWRGEGTTLTPLATWTLPDSLGWFYASMTEWLGFSAYSGEGKVMGLAPYGQPNAEVAEKLQRFCRNDPERIYRIDPTYVYYGQRNYARQFTDKLVELLGPPRLPEGPITPYHESVAYETQQRLEEVAVALATQLLEQTGLSTLCLSGGVAMNCKMNGVLSTLPGVEEVFINPASHDSGTAMGAALLAARDAGDDVGRERLTHAYWGLSFSDSEIEDALRHCHLAYERSGDIARDVADLLVEGKIVGWFQGRAELGARALGARSILANPLLPDTKDHVNAHVKYREAFRPFAPSILDEVKDRYMVGPKSSPFMILAYPFREDYREVFPAVVHVDGSVRPQTVSRSANPTYWKMIHAFGERTGHPVVLNTSFNVRGEPIVNTPLDALRCFFSTGMDALAIGSFLLRKTA